MKYDTASTGTVLFEKRRDKGTKSGKELPYPSILLIYSISSLLAQPLGNREVGGVGGVGGGVYYLL